MPPQRPQILKNTLSLLNKLYRCANSNHHPLTLVSPKTEKIRQAITSLINEEVTRIHFVSLIGNSSKPGWMPDKTYQSLFPTMVMKSVSSPCNQLAYLLRNKFESELSSNLGSTPRELRESCKVCLGDIFKPGLNGFGKEEYDPFSNQLRDLLWENILETIYFFLGFTIAQKKDTAENLERLVRLLPRYLPVGKKYDEPGAWIVLVALPPPTTPKKEKDEPGV